MKVKVHLDQEGVTGPRATIEVEPGQTAAEAARVWASGQAGHPWDYLTMEHEDGTAEDVELYDAAGCMMV